MKKRTKSIILSVVFLLLLSAAAGFWYSSTYITIGGIRYRRDVAALDLSGQSLTDLEPLTRMTGLESLNLAYTGITGVQYTALRQALPECEITWTPIFQGVAYPEDTTRLEVTTLDLGDVQDLSWFPRLQTLNAVGCQDYAQLMLLAKALPDCEILYTVPLGEEVYDQDTTYLQLANTDIAQLRKLLPYLPQVKEILLTGTLPEMADIQSLSEICPNVLIRWQGTYRGFDLDSEATHFEIGLPMKTAGEVTDLLAYLPQLEVLDIRHCDLPVEEVAALRRQFPQVQCLYQKNLTIGGITVSTYAEEIDISGASVTAEEMEALLPNFTNLRKVIMCDCGIDNETMDALNRRHQDILFVWNVTLGPYVTVRTDITGFIPYKFHRNFSQEDLYNLRYCTELIALDVGHQNLTNCEFVRFMPKLKYLILADTDIQDLSPLTGLTDLVFLEIFMTYLTDYTPLLTLTNLKDLNLTATYGDYRIIAQMPWLERCWWGAMPHTKEQMAYLQEACPNTQFVFNNYDSTGNGWRQGKYYYEMRDALDMFYLE